MSWFPKAMDALKQLDAAIFAETGEHGVEELVVRPAAWDWLYGEMGALAGGCAGTPNTSGWLNPDPAVIPVRGDMRGRIRFRHVEIIHAEARNVDRKHRLLRIIDRIRSAAYSMRVEGPEYVRLDEVLKALADLDEK